MTSKLSDDNELKLRANSIRQNIIRMLVAAGSGHSGGSLGMADVFTALYFKVLKHNPKKPDLPNRDRLFLSNGHICPARYAAMAEAGYFPVQELLTLRKLGSRLQGHPHNGALPGLESSSGPLGQGLSIAIGSALAAKLDNKKHRVYCILSDGEHDEGQTWEAIMFAGNNKMNNVCAIMDRNNIQIDGHTEDVMPLEPLRAKYESFKWQVIEVDGHNINHIIDAFEEAKTVYEKPTLIMAHTIPGKGVSFMENDYEWHGKPPTQEQGAIALKELEQERKHIMKGYNG